MVVAQPGAFDGFVEAEITPSKVLEWPRCERHTPVRHGAVGVELECSLKAANAFFVVESKAPVETEVEPFLSLG